jgi:hypothetical protein
MFNAIQRFRNIRVVPMVGRHESFSSKATSIAPAAVIIVGIAALAQVESKAEKIDRSPQQTTS